MHPAARILKTLLVGLLQSPLQTLGGIWRRLLPPVRDESQVARLREQTRSVPLILQVETINVCNAACVFCAYPGMKRNSGVMSLALFEKVINDYTEMGGGPVSLTPIVGDALLDPHLLKRLRILQAQPKISQVTLTTNAIALGRYSDEEVRYLLLVLDCIQLSIGGLDAATYWTLYGVDRFPQVQQAMERLMTLKAEVANPAHLTFAFRTNDWKFEIRFKRQLDDYRRRGVFISHIWTYANYAGVIKSDSRLNLEVIEHSAQKCDPCIYASMHMAICWDGRITACGCADFEGNSLWIGQADTERLAEVWGGEKRRRILESFPKGRLTLICQQCSAYQSDTVFAQPFFREAGRHRPLPLECLQQFWGG